MSGGGGGVVIIKKKVRECLEDPLVSGNLPSERMRENARVILAKPDEDWTDAEVRYLFDLVALAYDRCG